MKTRLLALFTAAAVTSMNAFAHDDSQKLCYPLLNHEGRMGSTNSVYMPFMHTNGSSWSSFFYLTNTSDKNLNVKIVLRTQDGEVYTPTHYSLDGAFSSVNSPFDQVVGGAILKPFKTGEVRIRENHFSQNLTGKITWQADACLEHAMTGAARIHYIDSNHYDQGLVLFNGGQPF